MYIFIEKEGNTLCGLLNRLLTNLKIDEFKPGLISYLVEQILIFYLFSLLGACGRSAPKKSRSNPLFRRCYSLINGGVERLKNFKLPSYFSTVFFTNKRAQPIKNFFFFFHLCARYPYTRIYKRTQFALVIYVYISRLPLSLFSTNFTLISRG